MQNFLRFWHSTVKQQVDQYRIFPRGGPQSNETIAMKTTKCILVIHPVFKYYPLSQTFYPIPPPSKTIAYPHVPLTPLEPSFPSHPPSISFPPHSLNPSQLISQPTRLRLQQIPLLLLPPHKTLKPHPLRLKLLHHFSSQRGNRGVKCCFHSSCAVAVVVCCF